MALVALGTPGGLTEISSIALHIASMWPRPVTVVEADPDGGRLATRYNWMVRPGLRTLASMLQDFPQGHVQRWTRAGTDVNEFETSDRTAVPFGRRCHVVTAPVAPDEVIEVIYELSASSGRMDEVLGTDVLVSVGTIRPGSPSETLIKKADGRMLVMRRTIEDVSVVLHRRRLLQDSGTWTILTAGGRLTTVELSRVIHWPVLADLLPSDRHNCSVLRQRIGEFATSLQLAAGSGPSLNSRRSPGPS